MSIVLEAKYNTESSEKQSFKSNNQINIFLNERINSCIKREPQASPKYSKINRVLVSTDRYLSIVSPAATFINQKADSPISRKSTSTFRQKLKLSASRSSKTRSISVMAERQRAADCSHISKKDFQVATIHEQRQERRSLLYTPSDFLAIRKQIEQRFQRTKMILKEQTKMKKFQKIQQIYDQKFKHLTRHSHNSQPDKSRIVNSFSQLK